MNLQSISKRLSEHPLIGNIINSDKIDISGLSGSSKTALYSALFLKTKKPILVISQDAQVTSDDLRAFAGPDKVLYFPSWDIFPTEDISPSKEIVGERLKVLDMMLYRQDIIVVASIKSLITRALPKNELIKHKIFVECGTGNIKREELITRLVKIGYKRQEIVGERGEIASRGGIIDIFPTSTEHPIRIEFIGDKIESIRYFDAFDQRSLLEARKVNIFPVHELILEDAGKYKDGIELIIPEVYPEFSSLADYIGERSTIVFDDPQILSLDCERFIKEIEDLRSLSTGKYYVSFEEFKGSLGFKQTVEITGASEQNSFGFTLPVNFQGKLDQFVSWIRENRSELSIFIVSKQSDRLYELLIESGISSQKVESIPDNFGKGVYLLHGDLNEGSVGLGMALVSDREIFGKLPSKLRFISKPQEGINKDLLAELKFGDYVVHSNYGIGIYRGLINLTIDNALQEYIQIDYSGEDKLYVPLHQMGLVEKYSGGGDYKPKISRLGGTDWIKIKDRAKRSIKNITEELIDLYSSRQKEKGFEYPPDQLWQMELEKSFPYEETPDQERTIKEIKKDMQFGKLFDRLICGDVGYGKTEVALRIAFKTMLSGRQVALLSPTTVLADQHFRNFTSRLKPYTVNIEMLSRFKTKIEQKEIIKSLENGSVDMVIGTHRLLSKDIKFRNLGLIIVDEEQKFGVAHKEKLKAISKGVNVLTLSATPIPRTLYMALSGVKDMSIIATPPLDRSPVRTYLRPWNENTIKEVLLRELERGGQVYFVHNQIKSIDKIASMVQEKLPKARIAVAHGQMKETDLEDVMLKFINKEFNILVSTSIIESGLDIPAVNTVIIDHAENFGLSQLYQIRGRVGRSSTRAFAYLLYHKEKVLTDQALERLKAIQDFTALGSGYKLAMADLEIRGSGNILGAEQSGHMQNIGFDMYCSLLEESVNELKNIEPSPAIKVFIDLKVDAYIPGDYVPDERQRIALYRRMNFLGSLPEMNDMKKEMIDRFGAIPPMLDTLFKIIKIKIDAVKKNIISITGGSESVEIKLGSGKAIKLKTKGLSKEKWLKTVENYISN